MFASLLRESHRRIPPIHGFDWLDWGGGVLEFLVDAKAGDLRAGAVLPDEVYVL